jgi:outer membrane protein assembly factor BamD (BamD/ComL family)
VLLVQRAQDALRSNPATALALTAEHARRFPRSTLYQEREMITIEALTRSGRKAQARARAERFVQQFPRSPNRRRLETLFGSGFEAPDAGPAGTPPKRP